MRSVAEVRSDLLGFCRSDLIGPAHGEQEVLEDQPRLRYVAGVLFPQEIEINESSGIGGVEDGDSDEPVAGDEKADEKDTPQKAGSKEGSRLGEVETDTSHDETVNLTNSYRPSAIGLSFMIDGAKGPLTLEPRAAVYESGKKASASGDRENPCWRRKPLELPKYTFDDFEAEDFPRDIELTEGLVLHVMCRARPDGSHLITASLYNSTLEWSSKSRSFYQVGVTAYSESGEFIFLEYKGTHEVPRDPEELALEMLYRGRRVYGIGHGCAVDWSAAVGDRVGEIHTEVLPSVVVPPVVPLAGNQDYLNMQFLSGDCADPESAIPAALRKFCSAYESWIVEKKGEATRLESVFEKVADEHLGLCHTALSRMRSGIEYLESDEMAFEAFMLVNRAMLMQQFHSRLRRKSDDPWVELPVPSDHTSSWEDKRGYWRAFQLAFVLMSITSFGNRQDTVELDSEKVPVEELVDLIWFPTGGGKTEAYLGVTAFAIFLERLNGVDVGGCRVLMRYTLRLLTSQQFQRASSLICACELLRRNYPEERLGKTPITIGLWVGMSLTPNQEKEALKALALLARKKGEAKNPFQLLSCPWCGTELTNPKKLGYTEHRGRQIYVCPSSGSGGDGDCPFSTRRSPLPVCVVDESIYKSPPTMLIGTVDKFAMLAWREQAGSIFAIGGGPKLIIQDELHLITGPLGSLVGLYESVIDYLCSRDGKKPKIIASTATIRRADIQCRALYDRRMFQFPPPGLDVSDSFFAKEDRKESPGRVYTGLLPTATSSPLTAQIRSVVTLQQGAYLVVGPDGSTEADELLDPYWTLVQYFGSLKELGRAATFITADIPDFLPVMSKRYRLEKSQRRYMNTSEELTSRKNEDEIPKILKRLEAHYRYGASWDDQALDTVLATNMISVGVDVDRLGLMMIVTQPKGTAEYIQASSRVGRSNDAPGLILTLYNSGRPRDRSHYEQFRSYHESFYRFVEPTSVTPFSPPALSRALHAVLVIAGRHIAGWKQPADYDPSDDEFVAFRHYLRERVERIDPDHLYEYDSYLDDRLDFWRQNAPEKWGRLGGSKDDPGLMIEAGADTTDDHPFSWPTPTSLRNVDVECSARVVHRYPVRSEVE